jgi:hypothetical protein
MSLVGQISRLATVSKILYEQELLALRQENEALKLSLFWTKYSPTNLKTLMSCANECHPEAPQCKCIPCTVSGRHSGDASSDDMWTCGFKPWFVQKLAECQMDNGYITADSNKHTHECDDSGDVWDVDAHLVQIGRSDWNTFTYGIKLYKASYINDPELLKLKKLFDILDQVE